LVAATNPCPCGYRGDERRPCRCTPASFERYQRRLSGPLLDRFDLRVHVPRVAAVELTGPPGEGSEPVRRRVSAARARQQQRGGLNRSLGRAELDGMEWTGSAVELLSEGIDRNALTARGWDRVRRVARTVADLASRDVITDQDVAAALDVRGSG
jgi:magnesium chelatase family protein